MRTREGRLPRVGEGVTALANQGAWIPKGGGLAGPLQKATAGTEWVMVCIEHFIKWVELIPLPSKSSRDLARGFLEGVLTRYGAPREVLTDQGREFMGEF